MDNSSAQPSTQSPNSYVDTYAPPSSVTHQATQPNSGAQPSSSTPPASATSPAAQKVSQALEDQNIFHLLGIEQANEEEKEAFLDELQEVIWEDFLENDVELLLTEEEYADFKKLNNKPGMSEEDRQGEMINFLEKLVPDLEKIMLEKALELKEDMMRERVIELRKMFMNRPEVTAKVDESLRLIEDQQWRDAADLLNSIQ